MIKKVFKVTLISTLLFCTISFISVIVSLSTSIGETNTKPIANIGFPFKFYYQFWLSGSDSPNCGWNIRNFILDFVVTWILTFFGYYLINPSMNVTTKDRKNLG